MASAMKTSRIVPLIAIFILMVSAIPATSAVAQGTQPAFSGLLGGSGSDRIYSVVLAPDGGFYIGGETTSNNLPVSTNALDRQAALREGFVARLNAGGQLIWLTYLGGSGQDVVFDLALGPDALYVAGETDSTNFPGAASVRGETDAFVAAISLDGTAMYYSTLIGGTGSDSAYALAVEGATVTLTGITYSNDLTPSGYRGEGDAFAARLDAAGKVGYIRLLGGRAVDAGFDVAVRNGEAWVVGQTFSFNFPAEGLQGLEDGFVVKLDSTGQIAWSKLLGGAGQDNVQGVAVDSQGRAFVAGITASNDFPAGSKLFGTSDAFLARLGTTGSLEQSIRLGGNAAEIGRAVALAPDGQVLMCGMTRSADFPAAPTAQQKALRGKSDAFLASFSSEALGASNRFYATFLGGQGEEACNSLAAPAAGLGLVVGESDSADFPATLAKIGSGGGRDGFLGLFAATPPAPTQPAATNTQPAAATQAAATLAATATNPPPSPTAPQTRLLTPTIPLIYTPPPSTATLPVIATSNPNQPATAAASALTGTPASPTQAGSAAALRQTQVASTAQAASPSPSSAGNDSASSVIVWILGGFILGILLIGGWFVFTRRK